MKKILALFFVLATIIPTAIVFAKGKFDYIVIRGPGITEDMNVSNPVLTQDYFTFADFAKGSITTPAEPGAGFQVVRMIAEGSKGVPYDQLHYYPYTGYVFYDGIVNGFSEDGGKWYIANPAIKEPFLSALAEDTRLTWTPIAVLAVLLSGFLIAYRTKPKQKK